MVASRFGGIVHAYRSAGTHAGPRKRREASVPAQPSGRFSLPCLGRPAGGRQGIARSARVTRCLCLVRRFQALAQSDFADEPLAASGAGKRQTEGRSNNFAG